MRVNEILLVSSICDVCSAVSLSICFSLSHRSITTVPLETRNPFTPLQAEYGSSYVSNLWGL